MKSNSSSASELNPPKNITPSTKTVLTGILILMPLTLALVGFYTGGLNP